MRKRNQWTWSTLVLATALLTAVGCGTKQDVSPKVGAAKKADAKTDDSHQHADGGPHQGALAVWGDDEYHVEFIVDHAKKQATVYLLDRSATKAPRVAAGEIVDVKLTVTNLTPPVTIDLRHDPALSSEKGIAFVGSHEQLGKVMEFKGNIGGKLSGKAYSGDFAEKPHDQNARHAGMPPPVGTAKERELYLTPGGIYTAADIRANGATVPSEKFKGISWPHDDDLKQGDKVCPVTTNKADPRCSWIVNGQKYEFCCHPCLDKFLGWAKATPQKVKKAEEYLVP